MPCSIVYAKQDKGSLVSRNLVVKIEQAELSMVTLSCLERCRIIKLRS